MSTPQKRTRDGSPKEQDSPLARTFKALELLTPTKRQRSSLQKKSVLVQNQTAARSLPTPPSQAKENIKPATSAGKFTAPPPPMFIPKSAGPPAAPKPAPPMTRWDTIEIVPPPPPRLPSMQLFVEPKPKILQVLDGDIYQDEDDLFEPVKRVPRDDEDDEQESIDADLIMIDNVKQDWSAECVDEAKRRLLRKFSGQYVPPELLGLESQYSKLYDLLERTVETGESNSCLIIGPRASGKTAILQKCLSSLEEKFKKQFFTVQLNGFAQTDDRFALREIIRQLSLEKELQDFAFTSFAETFAHLLGLLSSGSADENTKPIVFVLDEFDLFAQHNKQSLLYNLFDVAQSRKAPIAVIGMTCRLDALEMLEKRVKSRFSHRHIYVYGADTFGTFCKIAKQTLSVPTSSEDSDELQEYAEAFGKMIDLMIANDPSMRRTLRDLFDVGKDVRAVGRVLTPLICGMSSISPFPRGSEVSITQRDQTLDSKLVLCRSLSTLETCLMIAAKKLIEKDYDTFNFVMVYDEYKSFMDAALARSGTIVQIRLFKKSVALKAFEHLQSFELFRPVDAGNKVPKEYRMFRMMLDPGLIRRAVEGMNDCPTLIRRWGM